LAGRLITNTPLPTAILHTRQYDRIFRLSSEMSASPLLALPRELREEILSYLAVPRQVYTSSKTPNAVPARDSRESYLPVRGFEETYIDSRVCLPLHPPANLLATCKQLREECLVLHTHLLNSSASTFTPSTSSLEGAKPKDPLYVKLKDQGFDETAEKSLDDGTAVCLALEVQRMHMNSFGGYVPTRDALSPRFIALIPFMQKAKKLQLVVWPGFDWLDGEKQPSLRFPRPVKPNPLTFAIDKILEQIPAVEELSIHILVATGDLFRWDLPDAKWGNIQPWLDRSVTSIRQLALKKVSRTMATVWENRSDEVQGYQPIYEQSEVRIGSGNSWNVKRQGGLRTVRIVPFCINPKLTRYEALPHGTCCRAPSRPARCQRQR
jgi:hypothetical protein